MYAALLSEGVHAVHCEGYPTALVEMESPNEEHDWEAFPGVVSLPDEPSNSPTRTGGFGPP